ncbi:MAG TPA: hypothetical protein VGP73_20360 [Thermoanaerobaculia bacterium]
MSDLTGSNQSFAKVLAHWERLLAGAETNRDDLPALEPYRVQLEAALADTRKFHERRASRAAAARQATRELRAMLRLGRDLASRFESGVRLLYGRRSPKLVEFGMKPILPRGKRKKAPAGCGVQGCPLEATPTVK